MRRRNPRVRGAPIYYASIIANIVLDKSTIACGDSPLSERTRRILESAAACENGLPAKPIRASEASPSFEHRIYGTSGSAQAYPMDNRQSEQRWPHPALTQISGSQVDTNAKRATCSEIAELPSQVHTNRDAMGSPESLTATPYEEQEAGPQIVFTEASPTEDLTSMRSQEPATGRRIKVPEEPNSGLGDDQQELSPLSMNGPASGEPPAPVTNNNIVAPQVTPATHPAAAQSSQRSEDARLPPTMIEETHSKPAYKQNCNTKNEITVPASSEGMPATPVLEDVTMETACLEQNMNSRVDGDHALSDDAAMSAVTEIGLSNRSDYIEVSGNQNLLEPRPSITQETEPVWTPGLLNNKDGKELHQPTVPDRGRNSEHFSNHGSTAAVAQIRRPSELAKHDVAAYSSGDDGCSDHDVLLLGYVPPLCKPRRNGLVSVQIDRASSPSGSDVQSLSSNNEAHVRWGTPPSTSDFELKNASVGHKTSGNERFARAVGVFQNR